MFIRSSVRAHRIFIVNSERFAPSKTSRNISVSTFWTSWPSSLYVRKICPEQAFKKPQKPLFFSPKMSKILFGVTVFQNFVTRWRRQRREPAPPEDEVAPSEKGAGSARRWGGSATMQNTMIHACTVSNRHQYNRNYSNSTGTYIPTTVNVNFIRFINRFKSRSRVQEEEKLSKPETWTDPKSCFQVSTVNIFFPEIVNFRNFFLPLELCWRELSHLYSHYSNIFILLAVPHFIF